MLTRSIYISNPSFDLSRCFIFTYMLVEQGDYDPDYSLEICLLSADDTLSYRLIGFFNNYSVGDVFFDLILNEGPL